MGLRTRENNHAYQNNVLFNYQCQRKNGTNKCTKHHLQENHIKSHYLLIKQQLGKTKKDDTF